MNANPGVGTLFHSRHLTPSLKSSLMEILCYGRVYCCVREFRNVGLQSLSVVCSACKGVVKSAAGLIHAKPLTISIHYGDEMLRKGVSEDICIRHND